jgi:amidophosphoribosyltransferase
MPEELSHNCGLSVAHTLHDAYSLIKSLQHRGREAAGIAAVGDGRIDVIKWKGRVDRFDLTDLFKIFPTHHYHVYMAHVRYATMGRKDKILEDAHPHTIGGTEENHGSHIMIRDCEMAGVHNGQVDARYLEATERNPKTGCDTELLLHLFREKGEDEILRRIPGSYTMAIADKRRSDIVVIRDRTGIKPGVLGWKDGKYGIASEDIAFRKRGGSFVEDLEPGSAYYIGFDGTYSRRKVVDPQPRYCFFEWNYLADVDSVLNDVSVRRVRTALGEALADEFDPDDGELVTYLPRSPEVAARSFAAKTGKRFEPVFYKMRGERSFQGSTMDERKTSIAQNLHLLPDMEHLRGMTVVTIDDSMVRGNNSRRERDLLYNEAGIEKVYHMNYTPPIGIVGDDGVPRGCMFGVDMPPDDVFLARNRTLDEISADMGMPVSYISVEGMLRTYETLGMCRGELCTYCIGGKHPFEDQILR